MSLVYGKGEGSHVKAAPNINCAKLIKSFVYKLVKKLVCEEYWTFKIVTAIVTKKYLKLLRYIN